MIWQSVVLIFLLLNLNGCDLVNVLRLKNANDDVVPIWNGKENKKDMSLVFIGDKPYINVTVNNQTELLLLIDTGASFTFLFNSNAIQELKLEKGYELEIGGWGDDKHSKAYQTTLRNFSFAGINYQNLDVAVIPIDKTPYFLVKEEMIFDGVIGHDVLRHFAWTFNRAKEKLTIANQPYQKKEQESQIPFETSFGKISVPITLNIGNENVIEKDVVIDTGSRHYFKLSTAYIEDYESSLGNKITAVDFGLSGRAKHQRVTAPFLTLGSNSYSNVKVNLIKSDDDDDWWVIGNALLSLSEYTIDYIDSNLYIEPIKPQQITSRFNLLGLELRKLTTGSFIVRYVFPELSASKTNIKEGTIISEINGISAEEVTENNWLDITNTVGKHELCSTQSKTSCWIIDATPIEGYSSR